MNRYFISVGLIAMALLVAGCNKGDGKAGEAKQSKAEKKVEHVPSVLMGCVLEAIDAFAAGKSTYENPACKVGTNKGNDNYNGRNQEVVWIFAKKQDGGMERTVTAKFPAKWLTNEKENLGKVAEQSKTFMASIEKQEAKEQVASSGVAANPINQPAQQDSNCTLGSMTINGIPGFLFRCDDTPAWIYGGSQTQQ